jgi:hypothetical protein
MDARIFAASGFLLKDLWCLRGEKNLNFEISLPGPKEAAGNQEPAKDRCLWSTRWELFRMGD